MGGAIVVLYATDWRPNIKFRHRLQIRNMQLLRVHGRAIVAIGVQRTENVEIVGIESLRATTET